MDLGLMQTLMEECASKDKDGGLPEKLPFHTIIGGGGGN